MSLLAQGEAMYGLSFCIIASSQAHNFQLKGYRPWDEAKAVAVGINYVIDLGFIAALYHDDMPNIQSYSVMCINCGYFW